MSDQASKTTRVTRITIGRFHNRGDYEHTRYEVSVELRPGAEPGKVLRALEELLDELRPKPPYTMRGIEYYRRRLVELDAKRDAGVKEDVLDKSEREEAERCVKAHDAWATKRECALGVLDPRRNAARRGRERRLGRRTME